VALVSSLVLVPLVMMLLDFTVLAYWRTKLRSMADALAIGAVAESREFHIPIPTEFAGYFPVNGYLINTIHLSNLETGGFHTGLGPELKRLAELNRDGAQVEVRVEEARVLPMGNFISPFMYVQIPVEAEVPLLTPFLGPLLGSDKPRSVTLRAESCAAAWYRPDAWVHRWWDADIDTLIKTIDAVVNVTDEPQKYYRLINCVDEGSDLFSLAEVVLAEHLKLHPEVREILTEWVGGKRQSKEVKRAQDGMRSLPEDCGPGDPCVSADRESVERWTRDTSERRKAEEEAERARAEAARRAAELDEKNKAEDVDP